MASNYDDVIAQLLAAGLIIDGPLTFGALTRCKVEGDRERRGWYALHQIVDTDGNEVIAGAYGIWRGGDNGATKIKLARSSRLSTEQRESMKRRLAEDRRRADLERKAEAERAADRAAKAWAAADPTGESPYLHAKGVGAHGVRFTPGGVLLIPMLDVGGKLHGLQIIRPANIARAENKPAKQYWPRGLAKVGHFHLIGGTPSTVLLIAEGYATAASLHEATGLPVAVAFDAANLTSVAAALHKRYKTVRILICADDDAFAEHKERRGVDGCGERFSILQHPKDCPECGRPHGAVNTGIAEASSAAVEVGGAWVRPMFASDDQRLRDFVERGAKRTDFNDLHLAEGLHVVRAQIELRLLDLGYSTRPKRRDTTTGGEGEELRPIETLDELLDRYSLVYGQSGTVFDAQEHCLVSLNDMRDLCMSSELHRAWRDHPERRVVRVHNVGFDPAGEDPEVTCNLWAGWPTKPEPGPCHRLLDLLRYICSGDGNAPDVFDWVLKWLAYPIQHPGAKMKTALVLHGPQGAGKNMFFEAYMQIFGRYGRVIGQDAIEDKFNDWASRKLFLLADEVVARHDLYNLKNKLKALITGDWIRINPKNMAAYDERNHVNLAFLSNESMPTVLEEDDRRHAVIWTPGEKPPDYYAAVKAEIENGGIAALHDHLLNLDLGDFGPATRPPITDARAALIDLGQDSTTRFFDEMYEGSIGGIKFVAALSNDVYELYRRWCARYGYRAGPQSRLDNALVRKRNLVKARKRYYDGMAQLGPHYVLMLPAKSPPEGQTEGQWLGECVKAFRAAVNDYSHGATQ
jgi:putative DNA primase/helicase